MESKLREQIARAAKATATVFVTGERGTGKELPWRAPSTPRASGRRARFEEDELRRRSERAHRERDVRPRGRRVHRRDRKQRREQVPERASGGTLFLDEVGDMPLAMQAEENSCACCRSARSSASAATRRSRSTWRVVAATNRDIEAACKDGHFRPDLFDRLNVDAARHCLRCARGAATSPSSRTTSSALATQTNDRPGMTLRPAALAALVAYSFPR